ncbi:hypothetical protein JOF56_004812 [Kibdelosporangium banguiense]|uniref:Uncharacterized protein n=1 Tax=Kibdelosporangium banguiense TaxID=1365924 RepID=A0ABS4TJ34_9PSEU|nr:hypothetical protein [Kibdelosporangium banguiense]MBP2324427.1 hypothetical protein [Kibdelosporangium banguiense]
MESLADRLDSIRLRVQAPGSEIYADLRNRKNVSISFGESVYGWMKESTLERLLASTGRLLYVEWVRRYRAELDESFLNAAGAETQNDRDFIAARAAMESSGRSRDGRVTFSVVGMQNLEVHIVWGTIRELDENEFSARVQEAVQDLADNYQANIRDLKLRYFA